jgi:hypothetical protein
MPGRQIDFAFELSHDGWSEKLAKEFALKLLAFVGGV